MKKNFALAASDIRPLAPGRGSCYASDRITVERHPVGFMYREPPDNDIDSGWRFLSDEDTQEYADDPKNFEIYDVNTIANYDPGIIEYLDAPAFSAFERRQGEKRFTAVPFSRMSRGMAVQRRVTRRGGRGYVLPRRASHCPL